jgi:LuxR family transcriptional regulator, maltose regulon positive regulatory protein
VWLAQGQAQRAADLLAAQAETAAAAGQYTPWLQLQVQRAAALEGAGQRPAALEALRALLDRAEDEGYLRSFVDEGPLIAVLLRALQAQGVHHPALARLLAAFPGPPQPAAAPAGLVEALSPRELEILALLAGEASNAEIAGRCFITLNTLKKHISNIYGKLAVTTRLQAVQRARQLKILD